MKHTILILLLTTILLSACVQNTSSTFETVPLPTVTTTAATTKIITTTTAEKTDVTDVTDETEESAETVAADTKAETTAETKAETTAKKETAPPETTVKKETVPLETTTKAEDTDALYIKKLFDNEKTDVWVSGKGTVTRVLADDNNGDRHQRFILELSTGQTLLIAHNIDIAPYLEGLEKGDTVSFYGEYYWSDEGGGVHWTHHDPDGSSDGGWLKWNGKTYK
jgi:hypothetical protein